MQLNSNHHYCFAACFIALGISVPNPAQAASVFHIGNSLTWDSQPSRIKSFAESAGEVHEAGYHIRGGRGLNYIWSNPGLTDVGPNFGPFTTALPENTWSDVTLQPFTSPESDESLLLDTERVLDFIDLTRTNPANQDTRFWIYAPWPERSTSLTTAWQTPIPNDDDQVPARSRQYYDHVVDRVRSQTDATVEILPVGDIMVAAIEASSVAYEFEGINESGSLMYRDSLHLSYNLGREIAIRTVFSAIYDRDPSSIVSPTGPYSELIEFLEPVIWRSVQQFRRGEEPTFAATFAGDVNIDGQVDLLDLDILGQNWGSSNPGATIGDFDVNGSVGLLDLDLLGQNWGVTQDDPLVGDANADGTVDLIDLDVLGSNWTRIYSMRARGDLNFDGVVDLLDLDLLGAEWGSGTSGSAATNWQEALSASGIQVPEPTSAALFLAGATALTRRRQRRIA